MLKRLLLIAIVSAAALLVPSAAKPLIGGEANGTTSYTALSDRRRARDRT